MLPSKGQGIYNYIILKIQNYELKMSRELIHMIEW